MVNIVKGVSVEDVKRFYRNYIKDRVTDKLKSDLRNIERENVDDVRTYILDNLYENGLQNIILYDWSAQLMYDLIVGGEKEVEKKEKKGEPERDIKINTAKGSYYRSKSQRWSEREKDTIRAMRMRKYNYRKIHEIFIDVYTPRTISSIKYGARKYG